MASHQKTPHHHHHHHFSLSGPAAAAAAAAAPHPKLDHPLPNTALHNLNLSKVDSQPQMVGPRTVQKVRVHPHERFNDSDENFERMINCITAKERQMKQLLQEHQHLTRRLSISLSSSRSGTRRSIGGSPILQLADVFANNGVRLVSADMPPFMQIHAVDCAKRVHDSMEKFTSKSLALTLKKEFDGVYGPAWHCIVGKSFGSFVTHSVGGFLYFSMAQKLYILLFKTTVQRAN
ncbi:uncharacterized protein LOC111007260 [Momordica charantia]|uniref:Uncharacterized protein LOC111007260 n=1 Tax=Momordica charantia TaxID=3673 RepID=A0A6J1C262_MOMCH|nr:uncharacterized protein LOC111007260 [Momordica charantia]